MQLVCQKSCSISHLPVSSAHQTATIYPPTLEKYTNTPSQGNQKLGYLSLSRQNYWGAVLKSHEQERTWRRGQWLWHFSAYLQYLSAINYQNNRTFHVRHSLSTGILAPPLQPLLSCSPLSNQTGIHNDSYFDYSMVSLPLAKAARFHRNQSSFSSNKSEPPDAALRQNIKTDLLHPKISLNRKNNQFIGNWFGCHRAKIYERIDSCVFSPDACRNFLHHDLESGLDRNSRNSSGHSAYFSILPDIQKMYLSCRQDQHV